MKREKTTATLLIAIFMISTLSVMSIGAPADGYMEAVLDAADRLVDTQNDDGSFDWKLGQGHTWDNAQGITAIGILKAHELLDKTDYETALAKAYAYMIAPIFQYYAYPDVTFYVRLAKAAATDSTLLAAIQNEVSGTTIQDILDRAKFIWDFRLNRDGPTPAAMAVYELGTHRKSELAFWDLGAAVKAALVLDPHFVTDYKAQALAIAGVMYANLQLGSTYYFDITDTTELFYALALSGGIEAFSELGMYPTMTRTMTTQLIANQYVAGYWDQGGDTVLPVISDKESVQTTSYAVMALIAQGDADALVAASKGGDWIVSTQNPDGGWCPGYVGATLENLEVDSEAAWALSGLVEQKHEYIRVWWLEDATRKTPDGDILSTWTNDPIPPASPVGYVEFKVTGRAYHGDMEWFYNYWPLPDFESSPLVIANGKFAAWARYTSTRSGLPILDKIRGKLTIGGGTAEGAYIQYSYAFGTAEDVLAAYEDAVETDESGMWHIGTTEYTVHGQTPTI